MTTPTYQNWERFWQMHITEDFRSALAKAGKENCGAIRVLDEVREFYSALASDTGNAVMPDTLNTIYTRIANHLSVSHDLPELDPNEVTEEEYEDLSPVFDALYEAMPQAFVEMVAKAISSNSHEN